MFTVFMKRDATITLFYSRNYNVVSSELVNASTLLLFLFETNISYKANYRHQVDERSNRINSIKLAEKKG